MDSGSCVVVRDSRGLYLSALSVRGVTRWTVDYTEALDFENVSAAKRALKKIPLTVSLAGVEIIVHYSSDCVTAIDASGLGRLGHDFR